MSDRKRSRRATVVEPQQSTPHKNRNVGTDEPTDKDLIESNKVRGGLSGPDF